MANVLPREKQVAVVGALVEGCSMRATARMADVDRESVGALLDRVGVGCSTLLDETMVDLPCQRLELDELWSFIGKKQRQVRASDDATKGDAWTFLAICADTKVIPSFLVGKRDEESATAFVSDVATRMRNRVQVTTDGLAAYVAPILTSFAAKGVDYAQLHKTYESEADGGPARYSPPKVIAIEKVPICGEPVEELVSTSYVERANLSVRMGARRYTRLTNAFSKKLSRHVNATALFVAHYNFARVHLTLGCAPAEAIGVSPATWSVGDLLDAALARSEA